MNEYPFDPVPSDEIFSRLKTVRKKMEDCHLDGIFLTHKPDIYYFAGTAQDCYLYIDREQPPVLFVKRYLPRAAAETSISDIVRIDSVKQIPGQLRRRLEKYPDRCGLAFDVVPARDYFFYSGIFRPAEFQDASSLIEACRSIKSSWEIEQMKKSALVSKKTFDFICENIRPGISEMQFCGMFETFARSLGHSGRLLSRHSRLEAFPFHLLSGKSGGLPGALDSPVCGTGTSNAYPYGAGPSLIRKNEPVMIDFGTVLNGYHIDETRMFTIGKMPEKADYASKVSIEILYAVADMMKHGALVGDLFDAAVEKAEKSGLGDQFLGIPGLKSKFIGHGVGLELVENPVLAKGRTDILKAGMVFAVEPKFIFENEFGAGIESMILVGEKTGMFLSITENKIFYC